MAPGVEPRPEQGTAGQFRLLLYIGRYGFLDQVLAEGEHIFQTENSAVAWSGASSNQCG